MEYSGEQIMNLSDKEFISMKNRRAKITLKDGRIYDGIVKNLIEATCGTPPNLVTSIIVQKTIEIPQIKKIELKKEQID